MVYITQSNANRILDKFELPKMNLSGSVYKRNIYIFNQWELQQLLAYRELMRSPQTFAQAIYKRVRIGEDTFHFVHEANAPAYHHNKDCEMMRADYQNYHIPDVIKEKGRADVIRFRKWFNEHRSLLVQDPSKFEETMRSAFNITDSLDNLSIVPSKNTGIRAKVNMSLEEIESLLDNLINEAGRYYYENPQNTEILKKYTKRIFLAHKNEPLPDNDTGCTDEEVKSFLIDYEKRYKNKIAFYLREYYRISYNPDLAMDKKILDELGFRPCSTCCKD